MIYIEQGTDIKVPRTCSTDGTTVKLKNLITKKDYEFDVESAYKYFYTFQIGDIVLESGQYEYEIVSTYGNVVESGIAQVGDFAPSSVQYAGDNTKYITYKY